MDVSLTDDLQDFLRKKVQGGEYASEAAVVRAALKLLKDQEARSRDDLIDHAFVDFCAREADDRITLDEVLRATSTIPGSMAQAIIEDERADRF